MRTFGNFLMMLGGVVLVFGLVASLVFYTGSKDDKHELKIAKKTYEELSDNEFAEASYTSARQIYMNDMIVVAIWFAVGVIGGLIGLGSGAILTYIAARDEEKKEPVKLYGGVI